ncbi:MAG: UDP-N-acetylglucosamine 1-carboxyvinyltransferase [Planctomycetaceae bacterium]|nr:UDP-N-acetylglucosamine 1-carboxyvinyltransferase 1 [Planctomycetota bacterium]MCQ3949890.1 UDP-N-acetylglucosamine 1-carboxyvinyltransferase [Planctomycetota bacterium]NUO15563.1 UDP-N-acetylglucosamine 1-carboxyvinyltransferase [Planctomycetaceae bacterium]GIK51797.1 MAG: UDP-N-acetylglucosamine 1-carboxyvinyltransferase [Planctomycetota bacterium]
MLSKYVVLGGQRLAGAVAVSGSKNAALPMMAAALLARGTTILRNVPDLSDVRLMGEILESLGCRVSLFREPGVVVIDVIDEAPVVAPYELVSEMRASFCVLGPLLARRGEAHVSQPGGCTLGERPVDLHVKGIQAIGSEVSFHRGNVIAKGRPRGGRVYLGGAMGPSVTGTANVMCAAVLGSGVTIIDQAACEPEIANLAAMLNSMGARIYGGGTSRLVINGVNELHATDFSIIPDRIECGTFIAAAAITRGDITIERCDPDVLSAVFDKCAEMGIELTRVDDRTLRARCERRPRATDLVTLPYPGFPTDLQSPFMSVLCTAEGYGVVEEKIYPERYMHVPEYRRLGADIRKQYATCIVTGVEQLSGAPAASTDLRAGAGLVLMGLAAQGETQVLKIEHIDRGYERFHEKLSALGATIKRVDYRPARREEDKRRLAA